MSMPLSNPGQGPGAPPDDPQVASTPWYRLWGQGHNLANASLASSQALLERAKMWSSSQREGLLILEFGVWRSKSCKVEQWYQTQLECSRERNSTTLFTAIQHRSSLDAPFFHEFLLIPLADGSFYRVERTGVGSNVDAVRLGCEARDLIQWFPADKYEAFTRDKPSKLIAEVQFPREFDVLDVLAVCYSIQQNKHARRYTLQCYNCYFFCCAILSVLARRTSDWESLVSLSMWAELVNQAFDQLDRLSSNPLNPEAQKNLALRIFSLLDPENPQPAKFLLSWLRDRVSKDDFRKLLAVPLWWTNYGPLVFEHCYSATLVSTGSFRAHGRQDDPDFPGGELDPDWNGLTNNRFREAVIGIQGQKNESSPRPEALMTALTRKGSDSSNIHSSVKDLYVEERLVSKSRIVYTTMFFVQGSIWRAADLRSNPISRAHQAIRVDPESSGLPMAANLRLWAQPLLGRLSRAQAASVGRFSGRKSRGEYPMQVFTAPATNKSPLLKALKRMGTSDPKRLTDACRGIMNHDPMTWQYCQLSLFLLLAETLSVVVKAKILNLMGHIKLVRPGKSSSLSRDGVSLFDFQEHIRNHIKRYADRVDRHQLDRWRFVCQDVGEAILEIWTSMPPTDDSSSV